MPITTTKIFTERCYRYFFQHEKKKKKKGRNAHVPILAMPLGPSCEETHPERLKIKNRNKHRTTVELNVNNVGQRQSERTIATDM